MATAAVGSSQFSGMDVSRTIQTPQQQQPRQGWRNGRSNLRLRASAAASARYGSSPVAPCESYSMLGIRPGDSKQDLKRAYRRLALQYHPDVCKGDHCAPKFQEINAAYELLQKIMDGSAVAAPVDDRYYYSDDEEDLEEYKSGWEGAWVF